eukprot:c31021_g1_i1 orf=71-265(-)
MVFLGMGVTCHYNHTGSTKKRRDEIDSLEFACRDHWLLLNFEFQTSKRKSSIYGCPLQETNLRP